MKILNFNDAVCSNAAFKEMILELIYNLKYFNLAKMQYDPKLKMTYSKHS